MNNKEEFLLKKLVIGLFILLIAFALIAVGVTYIIIQNANKIELVQTNETGIDLYGTYDQNDLVVNELKENYNGIEIEIPELYGLKNTSVQNKINNDMKTRIYDALEKISDIRYANFYTRANFANVISISYYIGIENTSEHITLNYNLVDGERLKVEDLFVQGTDLTEIVRNAFYLAMVQNNQYNSDYTNNGVVSPSESELYRAVKAYLESNEKLFVFNPSDIAFYNKDGSLATIKMVDIADKVSIYSKYLTEKSLFERNDIGYKNLFTCANGSYNVFEKIDYGYLEDNYWYDVTVWADYKPEEVDKEKQDKFNSFKEKNYEDVYAKVYEYQEIANKNPDKFYILFSKPTINMYSDSKYENGKWSYTYSDMATVYENVQIFEMPMKVYEEIYKDKIIDTYRYQYFEMRGGAYLDTNANDGATVTEIRNEKLYNYVTGEELIKLSDVFNEDSEYMSIIETNVKETLTKKYNYSEGDAEKLVKDINCELIGTRVNVTIPVIEDFLVSIYFNGFDKSMLKLF